MEKKNYLGFWLILLSVTIASCSAAQAKPPYNGVFLYDNNIYYELEMFERAAAFGAVGGSGIPTTTNDHPTIVFWDQTINFDYMVLNSLSGEQNFRVTSQTNDLQQIQPTKALVPGVYCFIEGNPVEAILRNWCFEVLSANSDSAPDEPTLEVFDPPATLPVIVQTGSDVLDLDDPNNFRVMPGQYYLLEQSHVNGTLTSGGADNRFYYTERYYLPETGDWSYIAQNNGEFEAYEIILNGADYYYSREGGGCYYVPETGIAPAIGFDPASSAVQIEESYQGLATRVLPDIEISHIPAYQFSFPLSIDYIGDDGIRRNQLRNTPEITQGTIFISIADGYILRLVEMGNGSSFDGSMEGTIVHQTDFVPNEELKPITVPTSTCPDFSNVPFPVFSGFWNGEFLSTEGALSYQSTFGGEEINGNLAGVSVLIDAYVNIFTRLEWEVQGLIVSDDQATGTLKLVKENRTISINVSYDQVAKLNNVVIHEE